MTNLSVRPFKHDGKLSHQMHTGFTLIELLVVVGIIGLLLSLIMNGIFKVKDQSVTLQCKNRLKGIGTALESYTKDHDGFLPVGYIDNKEGGDDGQHTSDWGLLLQSHLFGGATNSKDFYEKPGAKFSKLFVCPAARRPGGRLHFSGNHMLMPYESELKSGVFELIRLASVNRPSEILVISDGTQSLNGNSNALLDRVANRIWIKDNKPVFYDEEIEEHLMPLDPGPNNDRGDESVGYIRFRHGKNTTTNILFADSHVATRQPNSLHNRNILIDE